jgi:hypothetical protein
LFIILHNRIYSKVLEENEIESELNILKKILPNLDLDENEVDQFILSVVCNVMHIEGYNKNPNLSNYIEKFCTNELNLQGEEDLTNISLLAYKIVIESFYYDRTNFKPNKKLKITTSDRQNNYMDFLLSNKVIRDFLALRYVIKLINEIGINPNPEQEIRDLINIDAIGYDFPCSMNRYTQELIKI